MVDLTASIEARSDQINADDLVSGPATYTVREVVNGKAEQPFDFLLVETERAYRPSKTMRRVIVACLGPDATKYPGVRFTLYREPTIQFGGKAVGGIRISHMSHIEKRVELMLQTTRGKREKFTVEPLADAPAATKPAATAQPEPTAEEVAACVDLDELRGMWKRATTDEMRALITQRKEDLENEPDVPLDGDPA